MKKQEVMICRHYFKQSEVYLFCINGKKYEIHAAYDPLNSVLVTNLNNSIEYIDNYFCKATCKEIAEQIQKARDKKYEQACEILEKLNKVYSRRLAIVRLIEELDLDFLTAKLYEHNFKHDRKGEIK